MGTLRRCHNSSSSSSSSSSQTFRACQQSTQWRLLIIIIEICKAPTLWLKTPNKQSKTDTMYIEMEMLSAIIYIYI